MNFMMPPYVKDEYALNVVFLVKNHIPYFLDADYEIISLNVEIRGVNGFGFVIRKSCFQILTASLSNGFCFVDAKQNKKESFNQLNTLLSKLKTFDFLEQFSNNWIEEGF